MRVPRLLIALWQWWTPVAHRIGVVQTRIILSVLYVVLLAPLTPAFFVKDALGLRHTPRWQPFQGRSGDLAAAKRQ